MRKGRYYAICALIGALLVAFYVPFSESQFQGDWPSLWGAQILTLGLGMFLAVGIGWLTRQTQASMRRGAATSIGAFFGVVIPTWLVLALIVNVPHCDPSTNLHADWQQPGINAAADEGFPGVQQLDSDGVVWARFYELRDARIGVTLTPEDHIFIDTSILDWKTVQAHLNATIGQVVDLDYTGVEPWTSTSVC